ncbi:MAG: hypothetical protein KF901_02920 [Myxococcales bacterium]|nr:hypothetical protein [Myxococcales bacterium]
MRRPTPHRALADALASLEVARRLRDRSLLGRRVVGLVADERPIVEALLDRIEGGRADYGPWAPSSSTKALLGLSRAATTPREPHRRP